MLWKIVMILGILGVLLGLTVTGISVVLPIATDGRTSWEEAMIGIIPGVLLLIVAPDVCGRTDLCVEESAEVRRIWHDILRVLWE